MHTNVGLIVKARVIFQCHEYIRSVYIYNFSKDIEQTVHELVRAISPVVDVNTLNDWYFSKWHNLPVEFNGYCIPERPAQRTTSACRNSFDLATKSPLIYFSLFNKRTFKISKLEYNWFTLCGIWCLAQCTFIWTVSKVKVQYVNRI